MKTVENNSAFRVQQTVMKKIAKFVHEAENIQFMSYTGENSANIQLTLPHNLQSPITHKRKEVKKIKLL